MLSSLVDAHERIDAILVAELIPNLGDVSDPVLEENVASLRFMKGPCQEKNDANCIFGCVNSPFKKRSKGLKSSY